MREYLLGRGVPNEMLLVEDRSTTTKQNMLLSQELMSSIKENPRCLIITSEFHVMRGLAMARQVGIDAEGLGSKTRYNPLFIGLSTREMVSFIFQRKEIAIMFIEAMMFLEAWRYVTIPTGIFS